MTNEITNKLSISNGQAKKFCNYGCSVECEIIFNEHFEKAIEKANKRGRGRA